MPSKLYLGIDLGTSSIKISLADENGTILDTESRYYPLSIPKVNWTEQDPDDWYRACLDALKELGRRNDLSRVAALSFSGQMHGLVILDENDHVIRPAILWNDSRTEEEVGYLNNSITKEILIQETGNIALCGFTAPKLLWLRKNEPDNFHRIAKIMLPKDYLAYRLSGVFASDVSDLSGTLFFDVRQRCYSDFLLDVLGIRKGQLPEIHDSCDVIGRVRPEIAKDVGLSDNAKVVIGGGDQAVGAIGTATIHPNEISISLGTSGTVFAPIDDYSFDPLGRVHAFRHATGKFHLMGCTLSAMGSLKWFLEDVLHTSDFSGELERMPDRMSDILFLPYLSGERSPINDPGARGYLSNLSLFYGREDIVKAVVEGIGFSLYDVYRSMVDLGLRVDSSRVIGGGSKSKRLLQILADIFGIDIKTITTNDGAALGAIILAMVGDGRYSSIEEACLALVHEKDTYHPDRERHFLYEKKFDAYKKLYLRNKVQ